jgi:Cu(I)/Ag(I) efflux system protein CusF
MFSFANRCGPGLAISFLFFVMSSSLAAAQKAGHQEEIHSHQPQNWRFTMPKGDPVKGREAFVKYECYFCHEVRGENFVFAGVDYGPELSQMGRFHPLEFFTESVINPNAVVETEYLGPDGKSTMPDYNARMTVQELIDLSAYLASLRPPGMPQSVTGQGKIIAVVPQSQEIVIDHGEIKGVMEAMTMGYKVSSPSLLKGIKVGDKVRFTLDTERRAITKIEKVK